MTMTEARNRGPVSPPDVSSGSMRRVMTLRDFRLLFAGASTSLLGDQFALIATPWLVAQLSNDPLVVENRVSPRCDCFRRVGRLWNPGLAFEPSLTA